MKSALNLLLVLTLGWSLSASTPIRSRKVSAVLPRTWMTWGSREDRPGDIYAQMGQGYLKEGQPGVALRKLRRGLEVDPE